MFVIEKWQHPVVDYPGEEIDEISSNSESGSELTTDSSAYDDSSQIAAPVDDGTQITGEFRQNTLTFSFTSSNYTSLVPRKLKDDTPMGFFCLHFDE